MSKAWLALLSLPFVGAAALTSNAHSGATAPSCEIRLTRIPQGLRVDGVVNGVAGRSGSYHLELVRSGSAGESNVNQDGEYTIPASQTAIVSESDLNVGRGDVYRIKMTVAQGASIAQCARQASSL